MKKTIIISLALMFALTGCFNKDKQETLTDTGKQVEQKKEFSLGEWFNQGKGVKCTIKSEEGDIVTYSQGEKMRMEGLGFDPLQANEMGYMINNGEWMYTWTGKKGTKMNMKKMEEMTNDFQDEMMEEEDDLSDWEGAIEEWEEDGVDYDCQEKNLSKDLFVPPSDVIFEDMGAMMEGIGDLGDSFNDFQLSDEFGAEEIADMEEMKKMLEEMNLGQ